MAWLLRSTSTKCQHSETRTTTANALATHGETAITYEIRAKPNSKIKKLRIKLIITKMQTKNFDLELLSLHPNWGHGTSESALGPRTDPCPTLLNTGSQSEGQSNSLYFSGDESSISSSIRGTVPGGSTNFPPLWVVAYERLRTLTKYNESERVLINGFSTNFNEHYL